MHGRIHRDELRCVAYPPRYELLTEGPAAYRHVLEVSLDDLADSEPTFTGILQGKY